MVFILMCASSFDEALAGEYQNAEVHALIKAKTSFGRWWIERSALDARNNVGVAEIWLSSLDGAADPPSDFLARFGFEVMTHDEFEEHEAKARSQGNAGVEQRKSISECGMRIGVLDVEKMPAGCDAIRESRIASPRTYAACA